jgi:hypothetical protein
MVRPALRRIRTRCEGVGISSLEGRRTGIAAHQEVIVPSKRGKLDLAEVVTEFDERESADLDGVKERLGYQKVVVRRIAQLPVGHDGRRDRVTVEHLSIFYALGRGSEADSGTLMHAASRPWRVEGFMRRSRERQVHGDFW